MMKIAFDHQIFIKQKYGGISRYFVMLGNELVKLGYKPAIFTQMHSNIYLDDCKAEVHGCKMPLGFSLPYSGKILRAGNRFWQKGALAKWKPDVCHETFYQKKSASGQGVPTVMTIHDMIHELYPEMMPRDRVTTHAKKCAAERVDKIICISNNTKKDLMEIFGIREDKISVVYHGFEFKPLDIDQARSMRLIDSDYILYVGARYGYKNFLRLLKAYSESTFLINNFKIVAFGGEAFNQEEIDQVKLLGLPENNVMHFGGDDKNLARAYAGASVFVYPSIYEGFGFPPLEAMSYDCPVIASATSSIPEVVGDAGVLVEPNCSESLRMAMEQIVSSDEFRDELVRKGRERIKAFSWRKCAEETIRVYKDVI